MSRYRFDGVNRLWVGPAGNVKPASEAAAYVLRRSSSANRANPVPLAGTVAGLLYAFVTPSDGVTSVDFYLDNTQATGKSYRREGVPPFDLGGGSESTASPFDTATLPNGSHTVTARISRSTGDMLLITETITVANSTAAAFPADILDLSAWKLIVPVSSTPPTDTGTAAEILPAALATYSSSRFRVTTDGKAVEMIAPVAGATVAGSDQVRSQLVEMDGASVATWDPATGRHSLEVTIAPDVSELTVHPRLIVAEMRDSSSAIVDVLFDHQSGASRIVGRVNGVEVAAVVTPAANNATFTARIVAHDGTVNVDVVAGGRSALPTTSAVQQSVTATGCHFRAGALLQTSVALGESGTATGRVLMSALAVNHISTPTGGTGTGNPWDGAGLPAASYARLTTMTVPSTTKTPTTYTEKKINDSSTGNHTEAPGVFKLVNSFTDARIRTGRGGRIELFQCYVKRPPTGFIRANRCLFGTWLAPDGTLYVNGFDGADLSQPNQSSGDPTFATNYAYLGGTRMDRTALIENCIITMGEGAIKNGEEHMDGLQTWGPQNGCVIIRGTYIAMYPNSGMINKTDYGGIGPLLIENCSITSNNIAIYVYHQSAPMTFTTIRNCDFPPNPYYFFRPPDSNGVSKRYEAGTYYPSVLSSQSLSVVDDPRKRLGDEWIVWHGNTRDGAEVLPPGGYTTVAASDWLPATTSGTYQTVSGWPQRSNGAVHDFQGPANKFDLIEDWRPDDLFNGAPIAIPSATA